MTRMSDDERQIRQVVATWMAATRTGDLDTVLSLMAEDVVFLRAGHPPMIGKAACAAAAAQARSVRFDGTSDIQEILVVGDWAFMWTKLTVAVTPPAGAPMKLAGPVLSVLRREEGRWVLARDANMLTPAPAVSP
jgi:uncharacterized protein (TIGR02246 family)